MPSLSEQIQSALQQGLALHQAGRFADAQGIYMRILQAHPTHFDSLHLLGVLLTQTGRNDDGIKLISEAIRIAPNVPSAWFNRGNAQMAAGMLTQALADFTHAVKLKPDYAEAWCNLGNTQQALREFDQAVASYDRALQANPRYADVYNNRGTTLEAQHRLDDALRSYDHALELKSDYPDAQINRANVLHKLGRFDQALAQCDCLLALNTSIDKLLSIRGVCLHALHRLEEALACYEQVIMLNPGKVEAHTNRGVALHDLKRWNEALTSFDQALVLDSGHAEAYANRGDTLRTLQRFDEALADYAKALALKPACDHVLGNYLHAKTTLCDWDALDEWIARYESGIRAGLKVTTPFPFLGLIDDPQLHKQATIAYSMHKFPRSNVLGPFAPPKTGKIRIGYYSADFHNHATAYLIAELFEQHDRNRFEIHGFSFGPDLQDGMRARVACALGNFHDVSARSDREIALLSRELGIAIAVDLKGYTQHARTGIFAEGCAPLQVNYLGYPGTMGASYYDYILADPVVLPPGQLDDFTERVLYLPDCYQVNDSHRAIADSVPPRPQLGLPEQGFVFCCFNNNFKILPTLFDSWCRILTAVPGSVLWLLQDNATAAGNLRRQAAVRGVDPARLVFAPRMPLDQHLARHRHAELFLDTFPCNAHTTASDALWAGLPVLTCSGHSFASRVAASLLTAIGLPELVTTSLDDYETAAIELALHPAALAALKTTLANNKATASLFNGKLFARQLETAFESMIGNTLT